MTKQENLLICLMEECDEVSQRVSKALRFGLDERQPMQDYNNSERIEEEINDLFAVIDLLETNGILKADEKRFEKIEKKKLKLAKYLEYSIKIGCVQ